MTVGNQIMAKPRKYVGSSSNPTKWSVRLTFPRLPSLPLVKWMKVESHSALSAVRSFQKVNWKLQAFHAPCFALPPSAHSCRSKRQDSRLFFFWCFFHFRAVLLLVLVTSAPLRKKGRERGRECVIQTVLSSPERKRERETIRHDVVPYLKFMHTKPKKNPSSLSPGLSRRQGSLHHATCSLLAGRFDCEFCGGGGGRTTLQGGDRSDEDHPSIFQKARDKKKKCLILSVHLWLSVGQTCRTFLSLHPPWRPGIPVYV